ncbi:hypothetical protein Hamer_G021045 [Homarus americanus]|uniref:Uncharacterized protein n=1 Tax=Homarus americanus TaxID=6706 RepID=A0A8J5MP58_HOMAM|nr:hypothetical protein Hamer_G021045 [Homarus americanus]
MQVLTGVLSTGVLTGLQVQYNCVISIVVDRC